MPNSLNPNYSLTIWDASSSELTLTVMFFVAAIFVPLILGYTSWSFWVMRGRITHKDVEEGSSHAIY
jgi:cytochrome d ubiquinol oxidase subunit II